MKTQTNFLATAFAALAFATPAFSQDQMVFALPDQCSGTAISETSEADMHSSMMDHDMDQGMGMMDHGMEMSEGDGQHDMMPDHVRENMQKMLLTMPAMRQGMMQQDADIAFACGMIAHHQAAIDMAQVVLDHGQDTEMRRLADEIIMAQTDEIEFMTQWLDETTD